MTQRNDRPAANRVQRSEFDRRAINVAGHVLVGIVWLERRFASVPDQIGSRAGATGMRRGTAG
jgi:hypothetical protein